MPKYLLTNKAVEDLDKIWNYTFEKWSENQADQYYLMLLDNCKRIAKNPDLGKKYDGVTTGLLGLKTNWHIIFYREIELEVIEISRILHERMDLKNRLSE